MLGRLPPEIAKLIHVYVFEDVLKELLEATKLLEFYVELTRIMFPRGDVLIKCKYVSMCKNVSTKKKLKRNNYKNINARNTTTRDS